MRLIELHILQSFPVTCLNRDDVGAPKSAVFGGTQRARVSSQCWKRAIRLQAAELQPDSFAGRRGHFIAEPLQACLIERGMNEDQARDAAEQVAGFLGKQDKKSQNGFKTKVALYLSPGELDAIAASIIDEAGAGKKISVGKGSIKKTLLAAKPNDLADIALFGRMVADDHSLMLEGAGMFSHAISTHRVSNEIDFFSAVDDTKPEESEGAGHIGTLEFNSACYYRYIAINWDLLSDADHLGHFSDEDRKSVLKTFLRACLTAVPQARKNSMLGMTEVGYVLGLMRSGQPLSLANAFEEHVWSQNGYLKESVKKMTEHWSLLKKLYELEAVEARLPDLSISDFCTELIKHG